MRPAPSPLTPSSAPGHEATEAVASSSKHVHTLGGGTSPVVHDVRAPRQPHRAALATPPIHAPRSSLDASASTRTVGRAYGAPPLVNPSPEPQAARIATRTHVCAHHGTRPCSLRSQASTVSPSRRGKRHARAGATRALGPDSRSVLHTILSWKRGLPGLGDGMVVCGQASPASAPRIRRR